MILVISGSDFLGRHFRDLLSSNGEKSVIVTQNVACAKTYSVADERFVSAEDFDGTLAETIVSDASGTVCLVTNSGPATFADRPWLEISQVVAPISDFMLKFALATRNPKRIFASSGGTIYGHPCVGAVDECRPVAPTFAYALGEQMIEQAAQLAGRAYGVNDNVDRFDLAEVTSGLEAERGPNAARLPQCRRRALPRRCGCAA